MVRCAHLPGSAARQRSRSRRRRGLMARRSLQIIIMILAVLFATAPQVCAQGGGASTTGAISGKVADSSGGVLPGVTVTATSPSLMGMQTSVTDAGGNYRFPALPPGIYALTYELTGFST